MRPRREEWIDAIYLVGGTIGGVVLAGLLAAVWFARMNG